MEVSNIGEEFSWILKLQRAESSLKKVIENRSWWLETMIWLLIVLIDVGCIWAAKVGCLISTWSTIYWEISYCLVSFIVSACLFVVLSFANQSVLISYSLWFFSHHVHNPYVHLLQEKLCGNHLLYRSLPLSRVFPNFTSRRIDTITRLSIWLRLLYAQSYGGASSYWHKIWTQPTEGKSLRQRVNFNSFSGRHGVTWIVFFAFFHHVKYHFFCLDFWMFAGCLYFIE